MNRFLKSRLMRSLIPYFLLGLMLIIAFHVVTNFSFFTGHLGRFWGIISPFITGAIIGYILNIPCSAIQRGFETLGGYAEARYDGRFGIIARKSRTWAVLSLVIILLGLVVLALNFIIPTVYRSVVQFVDEFPEHIETVQGWVATLHTWDLPAFIRDWLPEPGYDGEIALMTWLGEQLQTIDMEGIMPGIVEGLGGAGMAVFHFFIALISALYILIEKDKLVAFTRKFVNSVFKDSTAAGITKYSAKLNENFHQYIRVQTIDGVILGTIMIIVLMLFGSPFALVLGLILGILNYIPYFGSIVGTAIAVLVLAFTQGIPLAAVAAIVMFAIQQFDGNFIQPKLMGGSFSLSPLLIIISVTVGGAYAGIFGMLVAIPIVAILKDMLDEFIEYRREKKLNPPPPQDDSMFYP